MRDAVVVVLGSRVAKQDGLMVVEQIDTSLVRRKDESLMQEMDFVI